MKKIYKYLLTILISIFFFTFLSEIYLRYIGLGDPIIYEKSILYGYIPKKNQNIERFNNSKITINNNSFRTHNDKSYQNKIFFLGDSVTYGGSYIDNKELFSSKVCMQLNKEFKKKFSCYNGGVNAYGFENIIKRLEHLEVQKNDHVILTFILGNFYRNFTQIESLPYFTKQHTHILKANTEMFAFILDKIRSSLRFNKRKFENFDKLNQLEILKIKIDENFKLLKKIMDSNKNIIVILSPSKDFYEKSKSYEIEKYLFEKYTDNSKIFSINNLIDQNLISKIYYDNIHLNKNGHKIYSQIIFGLLKNKINNE